MAKEQRSPRELARMISVRLNRDDVIVSVERDPVHGWRPTVVGEVDLVSEYQKKAETIAKLLRARYDLGTD